MRLDHWPHPVSSLQHLAVLMIMSRLDHRPSRLHHWLSRPQLVLLLMLYHQLIHDIYITVVYFLHYIYIWSMYFMLMLQLYLIYMLVNIMMCILLGHVRYVHLMCSMQIDVYVIEVIWHEMYIWCLCCDDDIQCSCFVRWSWSWWLDDVSEFENVF